MPALDTNALVRLLVQDDAAQHAAARRLVRRCIEAGQSLFVPVTVALELEWVLRSSFGFGKEDVMATFAALLSATELVFESEGALERALACFRKGAADFADCIHVALAAEAGHEPLWTLDKAAAKADGAQLLS
jgi:predicted nucleic-acid-binding protein